MKKEIFGSYPSHQDIFNAESSMDEKQKKLSRKLLADTRWHLKRNIKKLVQGEPIDVNFDDDNPINTLLNKFPNNEDLLFLRESYENRKKIALASISDSASAITLLQEEMQKLDEAFGPETEEERQRVYEDSMGNFVKALKPVNVEVKEGTNDDLPTPKHKIN